MRKRLSFVAGTLVLLALAVWMAYQNRPVQVMASKYPPMTLEELAKEAAVIVEGTVIKRGPSQQTEIPTTDGTGKVARYPETPVQIKVLDALKGAEAGEIITYWEPGGDFATVRILSHGQQVAVGGKVLLFLNESGHSWGDHQAVYYLTGTQAATHGGSPVDTEELKARIRTLIGK